ncbi:hypothetical protein MKW92_012744 [Papaver armeniacum]|nr:hypothetical protein MKW92_012744 [Papaver armeniacum]
MADLVSAAIGAVTGELLKKVLHVKEKKVVCFKPCLDRLKITLETVRSKIEVMVRINHQFDKETPQIKELMNKLKEGDSIVQRCSTVKSSDYLAIKRQSDLICELDDYLNRFFLRNSWANSIDMKKDFSEHENFLEKKFNNLSIQINQLIERGSSSSNNGAGPRGVDREVQYEAAVPIKPTTIWTSSNPPNVSSAKANQNLVRHSQRAAFAALKVEPSVRIFRNDFSVAIFTEYMGGFGRTSLPEGLDLNVLSQGHHKRLGDISSSWVFLNEDTQLVLTGFRGEVPVDFVGHFKHVTRCSREHMLLIERVRHENVAPLRAYYYSCSATSDHKPRQVAVQVTLVHDYYAKGSVSDMLHGETKVPFDWDARLRVAIGVAKGIAFIHKQDNGSFFHGDIRSSNIFLNANNYGCISALGKYVYSYGVLLLELITGNTPLYYGIFKKSALVSEFWNYIGTSDQLYIKI